MTLLAERVYAHPFQGAVSRQMRTIGRIQPESRYRNAERRLINRSLGHAESQIANVVDVDAASKRELMRLLTNSLTDGMAFATLSSDGEAGAMAQWRAGRSYITIEVAPHGSSFVFTDAKGRLVSNVATKQQLDVSLIRHALLRFTAELNRKNPNWRGLFA